MKVRQLCILAATGALATSAVELGMRAVQRFVLHRYIYLGRDIVWMTPVADLLLFALVTLGLTLAFAVVPRRATLRTAVSVIAFVGMLSILTMQPWLAWWAMVPLAIGLADRAGSLAERHSSGTLKFLAVAFPVLLLGCTLAAGLRIALTDRSERTLPTRTAHGAGHSPNVLIIVWDAVRAQDMSLYGYARHTTPRLDAFAARGVAFDRAISTSSYTLPTHVSLFTGRWPHQFTASWEQPLDASTPTLAEVLRQRGYRTGLFSANHLFVTWEHGLLRGFTRGDDYAHSAGELARSSALVKWVMSLGWVRPLLNWYDVPGRRSTADIGRTALAWIERDTTRPFLAFLNVYDAHAPYLPPEPFEGMFAPATMTSGQLRRERRLAAADPTSFSADDVARLRTRYDGAIASTDHDVGVLLDSLAGRGILENTLVVILGDHGEGFGEHRAFGHGHHVYSEVTHVPLVMVLPRRIPAGLRIPGVTTVRDVAATIGEFVAPSSLPWPLPGRSLTRFWADSSAVRLSDTVLTEVDFLRSGEKPWYPARRGNVRSIIVWPYQLIVGADSTELYDLSIDPYELHDLAVSPAGRMKRDSLALLLRGMRHDAVKSKR